MSVAPPSPQLGWAIRRVELPLGLSANRLALERNRE